MIYTITKAALRRYLDTCEDDYKSAYHLIYDIDFMVDYMVQTDMLYDTMGVTKIIDDGSTVIVEVEWH